jgi:hypothetical protein
MRRANTDPDGRFAVIAALPPPATDPPSGQYRAETYSQASNLRHWKEAGALNGPGVGVLQQVALPVSGSHPPSCRTERGSATESTGEFVERPGHPNIVVSDAFTA